VMALVFRARRFHSALCLCGCPAFQEGIGASQQGAHSQHGWGYGVQSHFGESRIRLGAKVGESEFLEGYRGQVQHTGSACLFFSVNVVHILIGAGGNAVVCLLKDFFPGPETQTISRASLDTSRCDNVFVV